MHNTHTCWLFSLFMENSSTKRNQLPCPDCVACDFVLDSVTVSKTIRTVRTFSMYVYSTETLDSCRHSQHCNLHYQTNKNSEGFSLLQFARYQLSCFLVESKKASGRKFLPLVQGLQLRKGTPQHKACPFSFRRQRRGAVARCRAGQQPPRCPSRVKHIKKDFHVAFVFQR